MVHWLLEIHTVELYAICVTSRMEQEGTLTCRKLKKSKPVLAAESDVLQECWKLQFFYNINLTTLTNENLS